MEAGWLLCHRPERSSTCSIYPSPGVWVMVHCVRPLHPPSAFLMSC
jgi:hypothetical protein